MSKIKGPVGLPLQATTVSEEKREICYAELSLGDGLSESRVTYHSSCNKHHSMAWGRRQIESSCDGKKKEHATTGRE